MTQKRRYPGMGLRSMRRREVSVYEIKLDSHTHTIASGHAYNTILEMAAAAAAKKLELLAITEHSVKMPGSCNEMYFHNLKVLPGQISGVEILYGAELNIMDYDGNVDLKDSIIEKMDVCIASLHIVCIEPGTVSQNTSALVRAAENPRIHIIGHPDDGRYPVDYDTLAAAARQNHVLLELNNHSLDPGSSRMNARENDLQMLAACMKYNTSIILNSDAHWRDDIADTRYSLPLLKEMHFPEELVVNRSVREYKAYINRG